MADVFISYSKLERQLTESLAEDLESVGLTVWWDTSILPGDSFKDIILGELNGAKAAIVIWTRNSVKSDWVYSEAVRARRQKKLISVKEAELDVYDIPPPFDAVHTDLLENRNAITRALEKLGLNLSRQAAEDVSPLDAQEQEAVRWLEIRQSADENEFRSFVGQFADGAFRSKAIAKLDNISWTKTLGNPTLPDLQHYLDEFPNGAFRAEALSRIAAWRSAEKVTSATRTERGATASRDDLKRIRGIGVLIENRLNAMGVTSYKQVAAWTATDVERISQVLDFKGRIERENWVEQARILASGGATEFAHRVDLGEMDTGRYKR